MRFSEQRDAIGRAIMAVQHACPTIKKTKDVDAGTYKYKYVPHEIAWDSPVAKDGKPFDWANATADISTEDAQTVQKLCNENGLCVTQGGKEGAGGTQWLTTCLIHVDSGQWKEDDIRVESAKAGFQAMGAAWSYARRIGLLAALGIVPEGDDTDSANELQGRTAKPARQTPAARPTGVTDDRQKVEEVLSELPKAETSSRIDELAKSIKECVPADMKPKVRAAFNEHRARVAAAMRAQ